MADEKVTFRRSQGKPKQAVGNYCLEAQLRHQRQQEEREEAKHHRAWTYKFFCDDDEQELEDREVY